MATETTPAEAPFGDHWEHLRAELRLLDAQLLRAVGRWRSEVHRDGARVTEWGHGLFVGDDEIDVLLAGAGSIDPIELRGSIDERARRGTPDGSALPLDWLARTFSLSAFERQVVILCVAPELDAKYPRIYAYLHDDVARRRPTVALALALLPSDLETRSRARRSFSEGAPLRRAGLIDVLDEAAGPGAPRLSQVLALDSRIAGLLTGEDEAVERPWLRVVPSRGGTAAGSARELVAMVRRTLEPVSPRPIFTMLGSPNDAMDAVEQVCGELGLRLLVIDTGILAASAVPFEPTLRAALREALLDPAAILIHRVGDIADSPGDKELRMAQLARALDDFAWLVFVSDRQPVLLPHSRRQWITVEAPPADLRDHRGRWTNALVAAGIPATTEDADVLAARFQLSPSAIEAGIASARTRAHLAGEAPSLRHVEAACRDVPAVAVGGLARRIAPRFDWNDIVVPAEQIRKLREITNAVRGRGRVLSDWQFGRKLARGRGLAALFSGPSGTGKTMAAEVIARSLGLDVYAVDIANVVDKYIGVTEKNLARVFDAAETLSGLLFFDEADAIFGKRTADVRDAHDRYSNIEVGYLLQRIETYTGLVVLATNLKQNIDDAFLRRLSFMVEFRFPDAPERKRIWRVTVPDAAPLTDDIDWDFLARAFSLAGGSIRGAVLHAAYQAAAEARPIGMTDLLIGVRRELEKLGRVPGAADFGAYWPIVKGD